jgi:hypothetical protein
LDADDTEMKEGEEGEVLEGGDNIPMYGDDSEDEED